MDYLEQLLGPAGTYVVQVLKIIGIDIVLAGDNAVVIALACRTLPATQRRLGILLGAAVAVVMRIIFTGAVQHILDITLLKLAGGLVLFWIAVKLLVAENEDKDVKSGASLWEAVRIIAIADMVMSVDNVLAIAAAAHGDLSLIIFGLLVSIPLVIGGATLITNLLNQHPALVWAGAALLGWVAGELIVTEPLLLPHIEAVAPHLGLSVKHLTHLAGALGGALVLGVGLLLKRAASETDSEGKA